MVKMECPACHKLQPDQDNSMSRYMHVCKYCGLHFQKWITQVTTEEYLAPIEVDSVPYSVGLDAVGTEMGLEQTKDPEQPFHDFPRGLLDTSAQEKLAFRVQPRTRTFFALIIFAIHPLVSFLYSIPTFAELAHFSPHFWIFVLSLIAGIYAGMLAARFGYSEVLTAGGAGVLAGFLRGALLLLIAMESSVIEGVKVALPIFGLYSTGAFAGGLIAWLLRKIFKVRFA